MLPVSHAFHTPLVAAAVPVLAGQLANEDFSTLQRPVISTVTGARLHAQEDLRALLTRQVTSPVQFIGALESLLEKGGVDLLIEVGPGAIVSGLARDTTDVPVVAVDAGGSSLQGLLQTLGAAFTLGAPVRTAALFADRFSRPFNVERVPKFFANPCELAPISEEAPGAERPAVVRSSGFSRSGPPEGGTPNPNRVPSETNAPESPLALIRQLVAERAELPVAAIEDGSRMLSDLHLNSITVGQLVSEAAARLALPRVVGLTDFANASVVEMARALEELQRTGGTVRADDKKRPPAGVGAWIESFTMELVEAKRPALHGRSKKLGAKISGRNGHSDHGEKKSSADLNGNGAADWQVFAPARHPLAAALRKKLARVEGGGVLVCLPPNPNEDHLGLLLEAARAAMAMKSHPRFVLVQHGWGGAGFARTLHLETPGLITCIVNVPPAQPRAADWIVAEAASATGYTEAHYDDDGHRREPRLKLLKPISPAPALNGNAGGFPIGADDVLLVSGGGKGIAAECALALGRATGARLALLGRADPAIDRELGENLARIEASGLRCCYVRADVTDAKAVRAAVTKAEKKLGPVTALLHGAGTNTPQLIGALDEDSFRRTVAPKIQGARNLLAAVDQKKLRLFITFGSIIARAGLRGEADYATANEWLAALTEEFQSRHPQCRCRALEWSVWSGVGMGERLGRIESLIQQGITPISPDEGVRIFLESLRHPSPSVSLVVTGRFGETPTLKMAEPELPLLRFLERKRVYYPGVELIVDAGLSAESDPYLNDHVIQKQRLFPAVLGLEAMAQAAMALTGSSVPPGFEKVELSRPIAVGEKATTTIRIAALRRGDGAVEVCVRSEETDFQVDHFRAVCRFGMAAEKDATRLKLSPVGVELLPLDPATELYGGILFHQGRFARVRGYRMLKAKECVAELHADDAGAWFGPYLPGEFVLGNPGARDAAVHAIQACIPHRRILPTGLERVVMRRVETGARLVRAQERSRTGNDFIYDVEITDAHGEIVERWEGLKLRAVADIARTSAWPEPLVGPYLERRLEELVPQSPVKVVLDHGGGAARPARSDAAMQRARGDAQHIWRRPDGRPVTTDATGISAAHARDLTLAVAGGGGVGCDLEEVTAKSAAVWTDLLGREDWQLAGRIAAENSESVDTAATRLWSARECLKKVGWPAQSPLVLESTSADGWVTLRSGAVTVSTGVVAVRSGNSALAISVALEAGGVAAAMTKPAAVREHR